MLTFVWSFHFRIAESQGGIPLYVTELDECKKAGYQGYNLVKA